jgi:cytochrome c556
MLSAAVQYEYATEDFLNDMRRIQATKQEFYDGLRAAIEELEIELQTCKETM